METVFCLPHTYYAVQLLGIQSIKTAAGFLNTHHRHKFFEFVYCLSGEIEQVVNGKHYHLTQGQAIMIRSDFYHSSETHGESNFFNMHFDTELKDIHAIFHMMADPRFQSEDGVIEAFISKWVDGFIAQFGEELKQLPKQPMPLNLMRELNNTVSMLLIHAKSLELITVLAKHILTSARNELLHESPISPSQAKIAHQVSYYLETHWMDKVTVNEMAQRFNLNRSYLSLCFKKVYGTAPSEYLMSVRIRHAKQWLIDTEYSIEEMSQKLGFSSIQHFSQSFRAHVGLSPLQLRQQMKLS